MNRNQKDVREEPGYLSIRRLITELGTSKPMAANDTARVEGLSFGVEDPHERAFPENVKPENFKTNGVLREGADGEDARDEAKQAGEDAAKLRSAVLGALSTARRAARTFETLKVPRQERTSIYANEDLGVFIKRREKNGAYYEDGGASVIAAAGYDVDSGGMGEHLSFETDAAALVILLRPGLQLEGATAGTYMRDNYFHKLSDSVRAPVFVAERGHHNCCTDVYRFENKRRSLYAAA